MLLPKPLEKSVSINKTQGKGQHFDFPLTECTFYVMFFMVTDNSSVLERKDIEVVKNICTPTLMIKRRKHYISGGLDNTFKISIFFFAGRVVMKKHTLCLC